MRLFKAKFKKRLKVFIATQEGRKQRENQKSPYIRAIVLTYICENPASTISVISEDTSIPEKQVEQALRKLKDDGHVKMAEVGD